MDKFGFIKQLLENEKFNPSQKERFLKLVTNELEKSSGNQASILSDIETIKNELNIKSDTKATQSIKAFVNTTNLPIVDNAPAEVAVVTDNKTVNKVTLFGNVVSYTTGEITKESNNVTLIVDEAVEAIIKKNSQNPREAILKELRGIIYVKLVEDRESQAAPTDTPIKDDVDVDEKYVSNVLLSKDYVYLEKIMRDIDPRKTSLEDRKYFLSRVTKKEFKDSSLLEVINQKHKSLVSKKAVFNIDLQYYIVKQTEVIKGMYVKVGIPKDSFIIPLNITKTIAKLFKAQEANEDNLNELPSYYYPFSSYLFLFKYNQNRILKSTCHDIDSDELEIIKEYCNTEDYNFNCHLKKIIEAYEIHEKNHFAPPGLKTLFRVYLTGKNYYGKPSGGWSGEKIKVNWSCDELQNWSANNTSIPPNPSDGLIEEFENTGYEFTRIDSKLTGHHIQSFNQLVIHFKHLFHIRSDNSLRSIIERKNEVEQWNDKIDFKIEDNLFPTNIEHFADIDKFSQAYKRIILLVLEVAEKDNLEKPIIKLSAIVSLEEFKFSIHHLNTEYKKSMLNAQERLGQKYINLIINQINGLCELHLRADFGQSQLAHINLWNGKERESVQFEDNKFKGVEHIFVFPKKQSK